MSPEAPGLKVRVEAAIFLGASWLYRVSGSLGDLFVTQSNTGSAQYSKGDSAWLNWREDSLTLYEENM